jgi:predicted metal-dependent hydrolase
MRRAFFAYLKPGFHPSQIPNDELAAKYLAGLKAA